MSEKLQLMRGHFKNERIPGLGGEYAISCWEEQKTIFVVNAKSKVSPNAAVASKRELFFFSTKTLCKRNGVSYELVYVFWTRESAKRNWEEREGRLAEKRIENRSQENLPAKEPVKEEREIVPVGIYQPVKAKIGRNDKGTIFANPPGLKKFSTCLVVKSSGEFHGIQGMQKTNFARKSLKLETLEDYQEVWAVPIRERRGQGDNVTGLKVLVFSLNTDMADVEREVRAFFKRRKNDFRKERGNRSLLYNAAA